MYKYIERMGEEHSAERDPRGGERAPDQRHARVHRVHHRGEERASAGGFRRPGDIFFSGFPRLERPLRRRASTLWNSCLREASQPVCCVGI